MSAWVHRILGEFPSDLARLWIAADPDAVLLDERILAGLRARGFEVLPFEDPMAFRAEYEEHYRQAWDRGEDGRALSLVLHLRCAEPDALPWDYLRQARTVHLSLANLFPALSYGVVRQVAAEHLDALFDAHAKHASQPLGEAATKDFILTHVFRLAPHLITRMDDLWRELLRLHHRDLVLPPVLIEHMAKIIGANDTFSGLPIDELLSSKASTLRCVQDAWYRYLKDFGITGSRIAEATPPGHGVRIDIPFAHPDIRGLVASMFLDGTLHPLTVHYLPANLPATVSKSIAIGIVKDAAALRNLVVDGLKALVETLPTTEATHRDWGAFARRFGEILARFHNLDTARAQGLRAEVAQLQRLADERLLAWMTEHYADLPSLPAANAPAMVHQIPRFLTLRRNAAAPRVALLVFDGLALDQWVQIREAVTARAPRFAFAEGACFAWLPTLTAVSRQALFSGLRPREFADSLETTHQEPGLWSRFWQDQGLRPAEVLYRKGVRRVDQLDEVGAALANPAIQVAGIVVDTIDLMVHGAFLGKREIASQIASWCESGFVDRLFALLLDQGFQVYLTADHGNCEAIGIGRPNQGVIAETRGERVRVYRSALLRAESAGQCPGTFSLEVPAWPPDFLPLFAAGRTAFVMPGDALVSHGGCSIEELIVPFVKVSDVR